MPKQKQETLLYCPSPLAAPAAPDPGWTSIKTIPLALRDGRAPKPVEVYLQPPPIKRRPARLPAPTGAGPRSSKKSTERKSTPVEPEALPSPGESFKDLLLDILGSGTRRLRPPPVPADATRPMGPEDPRAARPRAARKPWNKLSLRLPVWSRAVSVVDLEAVDLEDFDPPPDVSIRELTSKRWLFVAAAVACLGVGLLFGLVLPGSGGAEPDQASSQAADEIPITVVSPDAPEQPDPGYRAPSGKTRPKGQVRKQRSKRSRSRSRSRRSVDPDAILAAGTSGPDRAPVDADAILAAGLQQSAGMQRSRRPSRRFASSFRPVKPAWMQ